MLPRWLLDFRHKFIPRERLRIYPSAFWLTDRMGKIWRERRNNQDPYAFHGIENLARRAMFMELQNAFTLLVHERQVRQSARCGYDLRFPMYARKFMEFAFAVPERMRMRGAVTKFVHIRALADLIPNIVASRRSKAEFSLAFTRHLDKIRTVLVEDLPLNGNGNLDSTGMARLYDFYCKAPYGQKPIWELWGIFSCEGVFGAVPG